ncbi:MAG: FkbM family methyltransferase [Candidatus Omnitrophica bacterium]|nr:FkbM family methyltransferase [Candidatus Omnitrophota bacterium]
MNAAQKLFSLFKLSTPLVYVDAGAMGGVAGYWQKLNPLVHVVAFEPDQREFAKLKSTERTSYLPYALHDTRMALAFYVSRQAGKSSVYRPDHSVIDDFADAKRYETVQELVVPQDRVRTLDEALHETKYSRVDFIKLDTQGSELSILKGGLNALKYAFGVEVEVEFLKLYEGQPLFRDVDGFLDERGFQCVDIRRAFWKRKDFHQYIGRGQLVFGDALYFRREDAFLDSLVDLDPWQKTEKIIKAVMICMVYRLPDMAVSLIGKAFVRKYFDDHERQMSVHAVRQEATRWGLPWLPGRVWLARAFNRLSEILRPASFLGWADGDRHIANTRNR